MDWTDEPATWRQLKSLKELGYTLEHRLTKLEAADLIRNLGGRPEGEGSLVGNRFTQAAAAPDAYQLRTKAEKARLAVAEAGKARTEKSEHQLDVAVVERQEFWLDTCREAGKSRGSSMQIFELYQKHGCRFTTPARTEVQYILDALDSAMPFWDRDHPELFYQTLELNFPGLLRRASA
jgi:hypothetical protein